jgi:hypothetical protein
VLCGLCERTRVFYRAEGAEIAEAWTQFDESMSWLGVGREGYEKFCSGVVLTAVGIIMAGDAACRLAKRCDEAQNAIW